MPVTYLKIAERSLAIRRNALYIGVGFALLYFLLGMLILHSDRYRASGIHDNDMFFQADSQYAVENLTQPDNQYKRVHLHPTFVIMFKPLGVALNSIIHQPQLTVSILCAMVGGLNVGLLIYFFSLLKLPSRWCGMLGIAFGLSSTQLVFSTVPDTYVFSATGMILLLIAGVKKWKIQYWAFITVYLLGVTITNAIPALLAVFYFAFSGRFREVWKERLALVQYGTITAGSVVLLALLQKLLCNLWILDYLYRVDRERGFIFVPHTFSEGLLRVASLTEHFFVFNIVSPFASLVRHPLDDSIQLLSFQNSSLLDYSVAGYIILLLWLSILGLGTHLFVKYRLYQLTFVKALLSILLFHFLLHFWYGDDLMLYTGHWTVIIFGLAAYMLRSVRFFERYATMPLLWPVLFCILLAVNNSYLIYNMATAYHK